MNPDCEDTLLAIDTSSPACSVALLHQGNIYQLFEPAARKHTAALLPLTNQILINTGVEKTAIKGIIISAGPGAFTGLRIGAAVAMGLAGAWHVRLLPLSSLALLAATAKRITGYKKILAVTDARMDEIYAGLYYGQENIGSDRVCLPEHLPPDWFDEEILAAGSGTIYASRFPCPVALAESTILPEAQDAFALLHTAHWQPPATGIELNYLRNEVTQI